MNIQINFLRFACLIISLLSSATGFGQVGIGTSTPHASAQLELNAANRGFLPTRIALTSVNDLTTVPSPAAGLMVYNTATAGTSPNNVSPGYYYFNGTKWVKFGLAAKLDDLDDARYDSIKANMGIGGGALTSLIPSANVWESIENIAIGNLVLNKTTTGHNNLGIGNRTLKFNTTGSGNVGIGEQTLYINETGNNNTAVGHYSGSSGNYNTSLGYSALGGWGGNYNTAVGYRSMFNEMGPGQKNTLIGAESNIPNEAGSYITNSSALGYGALIRASNTIQLGNDSIKNVLTSGKIKGLGYLTTGTALTSVTDLSTIASPDTGLIVYNKSTAGTSPNNVTPGYYYFNGLKWSRLTGASKLDELEDASYDASRGNMAIGSGSLINIMSGGTNLAIGKDVLKSNVSGTMNLALGNTALYSNTTGSGNMALGWGALYDNVSGVANVALGIQTLYMNTGGKYNTGLGSFSLISNTTGHNNEAIGAYCLSQNTTGSENTAVGSWALNFNGTGSYNVAVGANALMYNATGNYNTAIGYQATVSTGNLTNATAIGYGAYVSASNTIQLGNHVITDVKTTGNITANGILLTSDARLKTNIEGIEGGLETLLRLRPYSYQKRSGFEPGYHEDKEYGFLAQDIREILPELVKEGNDPDKALTVNYTALIPILTKAIQEQQKEIDELKALLKKKDRNTRKNNRRS